GPERNSSGEIAGLEADGPDGVRFAGEAQPPANTTAISPHASRGAMLRIAPLLARPSLLKIQIFRIIVPHVGFFELRVVEVHFLILVLDVFFDLFPFVFKRVQVVEVVVLGTASEMPGRNMFRFACSATSARHLPLLPLQGDTQFCRKYIMGCRIVNRAFLSRRHRGADGINYTIPGPRPLTFRGTGARARG